MSQASPQAVPTPNISPVRTGQPSNESLLATMMARSTPTAFLHSRPVRRAIVSLEYLTLILAFTLTLLLFRLHTSFIHNPGCAELVQPHVRYPSPRNPDPRNIIVQLTPVVPAHDEQATLTARTRLFDLLPWYLVLKSDGTTSCNHDNTSQRDQSSCDTKNDNDSGNNPPVCSLSSAAGDRFCSHSEPQQYFRFARERGVLLLSNDALQRLNISTKIVPLPAHAPCLGGRITAAVLSNFIGYHSVAANAFRVAVIDPNDARHPFSAGYIHPYPSTTLINLNHVAAAPTHLRTVWKVGALITAAFIMCTTWALVSFTLKEVQVRIVQLTIDLQYAMRSAGPDHDYLRIFLRYAMDALVFIPIVAGVMFFLFEFFNDQSLAFAVLSVAWLAEVAVNGSTRHCVSRQYLPRLFFIYFGGFHFYFFSFPLGFTWLAFATSVAFMFHACLAIWNRFELPLMWQEVEHLNEWR